MFVKGGPFLNRTASGRYRALIKKGMPKLVYWTDGRRIVFILCGTPETKTRRIPHPVEDYGSHVATPTILSTASFFSLSLTTVYVTKNAATTTQHPHNHKNKINNTARTQVALSSSLSTGRQAVPPSHGAAASHGPMLHTLGRAWRRQKIER